MFFFSFYFIFIFFIYLQLVKYCKCEVRKFPFKDFPPHVSSLKTYTWKPIILQVRIYRNFPKFSDKQVWANSADPDQTDQDLHCLLFSLHLWDALL